MHIDRFEELVAPRIMDRGTKYFQNGHIQEVEQVDQGEFCALVAGTESYNIYLRFDREYNLLFHYCNCLYTDSPICKHKVAVVLHIRKARMLEQVPSASGLFASIKNKLEEYNERELRQLILDQTKLDSKFRHRVSREMGLDSGLTSG